MGGFSAGKPGNRGRRSAGGGGCGMKLNPLLSGKIFQIADAFCEFTAFLNNI